ncbi:hypothetical protein [Nodularia spumigena]|uniref:hypothetical protein n=1 Tax=Nodularia spumigena TaxID=70799 RepID=UPI002B1EB8C4|nr:hypothetical protein [Nodularia spumigena]MEA5613132.1 hypothetical protein [Nodularia spumigena UHCC 0040]
MKEIDRLAGYLKGRDAPCPGCGYNLRDLLGETCPECGEALTVVKIIYNAPRASPASLVVGYLGIAVGWGVLLGVWPRVMTMDINPRGIPTWDDLRLLVIVGATLSMAVAVYLWNEWADEMTRRPARFRWGWAAACFLTAPLAWLVGRLVGRW